MFNKQNDTINVTLVFSTISILVSMEKNNDEVQWKEMTLFYSKISKLNIYSFFSPHIKKPELVWQRMQ